jgi:hypothetical protein
VREMDELEREETAHVLAELHKLERRLHDAIESVSWERRGFLQRLTRPGGPESLRFEGVLEAAS